MRKTVLYIVSSLLLSVSLTSCVSKKKFDELARAKTQADREALQLKRDKKNLEKEIQQNKDDFNKIRYQLTENNAAKDKVIDELYNKFRNLESKQSELKSELSNAAVEIKYTSQTAEQKIVTLQNSLKRITAQRDEIRQAMTELQNTLEAENRKLSPQGQAGEKVLPGYEAEAGAGRRPDRQAAHTYSGRAHKRP